MFSVRVLTPCYSRDTHLPERWPAGTALSVWLAGSAVFLQAMGELGGFRRRLRLTGVVLEDGMAIAVQGQGNAPALYKPPSA